MKNQLGMRTGRIASNLYPAGGGGWDQLGHGPKKTCVARTRVLETNAERHAAERSCAEREPIGLQSGYQLCSTEKHYRESTRRENSLRTRKELA